MARGDFSYMVDHLYPDSSLAAESYLYLGIVNSLMKNDAEASLAFQQAISRNPNLAKGYLAFADLPTVSANSGQRRLKLSRKVCAMLRTARRSSGAIKNLGETAVPRTRSGES